MSKDVIQVQIKALIPTNAGVAVFLGNEEKIFVIYVDPSVGSAINMFVNGTAKERPLTHDLMALILAAVGARVERVIVNDLKSGTYFGRLIITAENELQQRKIISPACRAGRSAPRAPRTPRSPQTPRTPRRRRRCAMRCCFHDLWERGKPRAPGSV